MATDIDSLQIQINAQATKANDAIDRLVSKLDRLTASLSSIDGSKLNGLANGVQHLGTAMQTMNNVKTADFTRLAKNLTALNNIDTSKLSGVSTNITAIGQSLSDLNGVSDGAKQLAELANGIKQLGYKSAGQAIKNIPQLATAMKQLMTELSKAPKVSQNLIDMTNALAKLARTGASSGKAAQSLSNSFTGIYKSSGFAVSGIKKVNTRLVSLIRSIAPVVGLVKLIDFGKQAMEISSDLTEVQNVVDVTFGDYASLVEDMSKNSITDFGMSELTVKEVSSRFQAMGTAMGFAQGKMADMSIELTKLTADMASFYNIEQEDVAQDLESIFTGQTRPLRTYGLDLAEATLKEWALSEGLNANIDKMSQAEKTMLRYRYVMANTGAAQGDFARTAETWANQVRILKQNFEALGSTLGGSFINFLKPMVKALNSAIAKLREFAVAVSNSLGVIFGWKYEQSGGGVTSDIEDSTGGMADNLGTAADNAKKLESYLLGIDELNVLKEDSDSGASGGGASAGAGSAAQDQWTKTDSILKDFESDLDSLYKLGDFIGQKLTDAMNSIDWDSVYEGARNFGSGLASFLNGLISPDLFGAVGRTVAGALNMAIYTALSFDETFGWENLGESIAEGINEFFATFDFKSLAETINAWVKGLWTTLKNAVGKIKWKTVFEGIFDFFDNIDFASPFLLAIPHVKTFAKLIKKLASLFETLEKYVGKLAGIFSGGFYSGLQKIQSSLSGLQKVVITTVTLFAEFKIISDTFENLVLGTENLGEAIAKIGGIATIAGVTLTAVLGFPTGIIATGMVGLVGALKGVSDAEKELIEQSEIEKYGDTISNLVSKINEASSAAKDRAAASLEYVQTAGLAETQMASDLAEKYFELAGKENLTNEEKEKMRNLASSLVNALPELQNYYNSETGLLNATKESIDALIQSRLREIQLAAIEEQLKQTYVEQADQLKELQKAIAPANEEQEKMNALNKEYQELLEKQDALSEYQQLSEKITGCTDVTDSLIERHKELENELTNGGLENIPTFESLGNQINIAEQKILEFQGEYEEAMGALSNAETAYEAVGTNISQLTEMLTTGMVSAAQDSANGYATALSEDTTMADAALNQAKTLLEAFRSQEGIDSHSPSKAFETSGKDSIDGYVLGLTENEKKITQTIIKISDNLLNKFKESLKPMYDIGADAMKGLYNGLESMESSLYAKAQNIADNVAKTIKTALDIHSPSKVMLELGVYAMEGLKIGLESLYKPIVSSLQSFSYDIKEVPIPKMFDYPTHSPMTPKNHENGILERYVDYEFRNSDALLREQNELLKQQNELLSYLADKEIVARIDPDRDTIQGFRNAEKRLGFSFT